MKVRFKLSSRQPGADLKTGLMDLDTLIRKLEKIRIAGQDGELKFDAMCDDWHRNHCSNPGGRHTDHFGEMNIRCFKD